MNNRLKKRSGRVPWSIWMQYILVLLAWAFMVLLTVFLGRAVFGSRLWDGTEFLYPFLHWAREYIILLCILTTGGGWLVISCWFISRPLK